MVVKINFSFFLKGTLVSFLYCFCSPDVQLVLTKRFYRWRVRWQTRNLTRENTRRFNSSQVCIGSTFIIKWKSLILAFLFSPKILRNTLWAKINISLRFILIVLYFKGTPWIYCTFFPSLVTLISKCMYVSSDNWASILYADSLIFLAV